MKLINCKACGKPVAKNAAACPKCGAPVRKKRGCGCLLLLLIILALAVLMALPDRRGTAVSASGARTDRTTPAADNATAPAPAGDLEDIPGIAAVDVHGNLTAKGFTLTTNHGPEQSEWTCRLKESDQELIAEAIGPSASRIQVVKGTVLYSGSGSVDSIAANFLGYLASLPYEGSDPAKARQWVKDNISHNAETVIGAVKFQIFANAPRARLLRISRN